VRIEQRIWSQACQIVRPGAQATCWVVTKERHDGPPELPIESLMLSNTPGCAIYVITPGTAEISRRLDTDPNLAVIGRSTKRSTALHRLTGGRLSPIRGVELNGRAGTRRRATPGELMRWHAALATSERVNGFPVRVGPYAYVRELRFHSVLPLDSAVEYGSTTTPAPEKVIQLGPLGEPSASVL